MPFWLPWRWNIISLYQREEEMSSYLQSWEETSKLGTIWFRFYIFFFIILEVLQAIAANYISFHFALIDVPWVSHPDLPFAFPVSPVHLYKCDARRESCGMCLKADPLFGCVWCKGENRCSLKQHCPHPQSMWLEHNGINSKCTNPRITKVKLCTNPQTK